MTANDPRRVGAAAASDGQHCRDCHPELHRQQCCQTGCAAAVPDPGFRDQFAEEIGRHQGLRGPMDDERPDVWQNRCDCGWDDGDERPGWRERYRQHIADALLLLMEARVQAADEDAVERAAQAVEALRPHIPPSTDPSRRTSVIVRSTLNRAARAARACRPASGRSHDGYPA